MNKERQPNDVLDLIDDSEDKLTNWKWAPVSEEEAKRRDDQNELDLLELLD